jgi:hypothetical protein
MVDHESVNLEPDPRFPSGGWTGFFLHTGFWGGIRPACARPGETAN